MQAIAHVLGFIGQPVRVQYTAQRVVRIGIDIAAAADALAQRRIVHNAGGHLRAQGVVRAVEAGGAQREHQHPQRPAQQRNREVDDQLAHGCLEVAQAGLKAPFHQRPLVFRVAFLVPLLDHRRGVVQVYKAVRHPPGQALTCLEAATNRQQGNVGHQGKRGREPGKLAIAGLDVTLAGHGFQQAAAQCQH